MINTTIYDKQRNVWCVTPVMPYPNFMVIFLLQIDATEYSDKLATQEVVSPLVNRNSYEQITVINQCPVFIYDHSPNNYFNVKRVALSNDLHKLEVNSNRGSHEEMCQNVSFSSEAVDCSDELVMCEKDIIIQKLSAQ